MEWRQLHDDGDKDKRKQTYQARNKPEWDMYMHQASTIPMRQRSTMHAWQATVVPFVELAQSLENAVDASTSAHYDFEVYELGCDVAMDAGLVLPCSHVLVG